MPSDLQIGEDVNRFPVGLIAGYLSAFSFTSISLANILLSDTLFFFLFLLGNILFLLGIENRKRRYFIISGLLIGFSILVRSIGQFWPLVMILLIFIMPLESESKFRLKTRIDLFKKAAIAPLIALILISGWMVRNYVLYSEPVLTFTSAGGPANVAGLAVAEAEDRDVKEIRSEWIEEFKISKNKEYLSYIDQYELFRKKSREIIGQYPKEMIIVYLNLVWANLNEVNELYRAQVPRFANPILGRMYWLRDHNIHYLSFWLCMAAFSILFIKRKWRTLVPLTILYLYYVSMIGFTQWQGSRLFYPGQIVASILIAYVTMSGFKITRHLIPTSYRNTDWLKKLFNIVRGRKASLLAVTTRVILPNKAISSRRYFAFYAISILIGWVILYHRFIFSDLMFYSPDMIEAGMFFRSFLVEHVKSYGSVPVWNPYIFCGMPFVDAFHGDIFYPLSFLKFTGSIFRSLGFVWILHVFLAGITAYATARQLKISKLGAAFAGIAYMFSGWLNSLIAPGHDGKMFVTALFPLSILFIDRVFIKDRFLNASLLGVVIGLIILTPHPQLAYYSLLAMAGFTLFRMVGKTGDNKFALKRMATPAALVVYAVILGLLLSAIQMLPGFTYTQNYSPRKDLKKDYSFSTSFSLHPEEAISLIIPEFCGMDNALSGEKKYWGRNSFKDNSEYAGLIPLMFAILGLTFGTGKIKYFLAILGLASLLFALGDHTPFFKLCYNYIPLIKSTRAPSMVMFLFSFAVSMLAGMGLHALKEGRNRVRLGKIALKIMYALPFLILGAFVLFTYAPKETFMLYLKLSSYNIQPDGLKMSYALNNLADIRAGLLISFILSAVTMAIVRFWQKRSIGSALLLCIPLLAMFDGVRFNSRFINLIDPAEEFSPRPIVEFIKENAGYHRAFGFACNELAEHFYYFGISSTIGYHGNNLRSYNRLLNYGGSSSRNFINKRFINLTGAKYIMTPKNAEFESVGYDENELVEVANFGNMKVMENKDVFPRTYLAGKYEVIPDPDSIYKLIYNGDDDMLHTVYLEEVPNISIDSSIGSNDGAEIITYSIDSILVQATCSTTKVLTISDNYFRDWHVYVDGREEKVIRTYGTFRGVILEPGEHSVVWKYIPSYYLIGKKISILAAFYTVIALLLNGYFKKRKAFLQRECK